MHLKPLAERTISADHLPQADSEDHVFLDPPVAFSYSHDLASHSNAAPTVNLNINLHSPANPSQPLNLTPQETIFTLVSQALQLERSDLFNPTVVQPVYPFHPSVPLNAIGQMGLAPQSSITSPVSHTGVVHRKYAIDRDATQGIEKRHAGKPLLNAFENASFKNHNRMRYNHSQNGNILYTRTQMTTLPTLVDLKLNSIRWGFSQVSCNSAPTN